MDQRNSWNMETKRPSLAGADPGRENIDLIQLLPSTTTASTTTAGQGDDYVAQTSYGLVGVIIFAIVIVLIIIIGRRRFKEDHEDMEEEFVSETDDEDTEKVQMRLFGTRESRYDVTAFITDDDELLDSVNAVTISVSRLTLSRQLGKEEAQENDMNATPISLDSTPTLQPEGKTTNGVSFGISGFILFLIVLAVVIYFRRRCTHDKTSHEEDVSEDSDPESIYKGGTRERMEMQRLCSVDGSEKWTQYDTIRDLVDGLVIDCRNLTMGSAVGTGQFGAVYEARLAKEEIDGNAYAKPSDQRVAVKTLKGANMSEDEVEAFLREGVIMGDFQHKHVLGLIGVAFGDHGVPMIILPFMANGSLRTYISQQDLQLSVRRLLQFGHEVAQGMEYLAEQKFVHRDLAARNCMLDDELVVKVADFGLSRDIYTKEYYASHDREAKLPVKWMALESLTTGVYTTRSDVWAFGVLLWELMTRGVTPYPDIANWDIRGYVSSGRRMASPAMCPEDVYELMLRCWREQPKDRPSFTELVEELNDILHEDDPRASGRDFYINVEPLTP